MQHCILSLNCMFNFFFRVKKCRERLENLPVVDPYPGQPYMTKKRAICPTCYSTGNGKTKCAKQSSTESDSWTPKTVNLPKGFTYLDIVKYSKNSGKKRIRGEAH